MKKFLLASLVLLLIPFEAYSKDIKINVQDFKLVAPPEMQYLKDGITPMIKARLSALDNIKVSKKDYDYTLKGTLLILGNNVSLDGELIEKNKKEGGLVLAKGESIDDLLKVAETFANKVAIAVKEGKKTLIEDTGEQAPLKPVTPVKVIESKIMKTSFVSDPMDGKYLHFVSDDIDNDGLSDIVLLSRSHICILLNGENGLNDCIKVEAPKNIENIYLSLIDDDKDADLEIVVAGLKKGKASSYIIGENDKGYEVITGGIKFMLRSLKLGFDEEVLIGQKFKDKKGLYGKIRTFEKNKDTDFYEDVSDLDVPRRVNFFSFEVFDVLGSNKISLLNLNKSGNLEIYLKDKKDKWRRDLTTKKEYGGSLNKIKLISEGIDVKRESSFWVEGKFVHLDIDKDSVEDIFVRRSKMGGMFGSMTKDLKSFSEGKVERLNFDGISLREVFSFPTQDDLISDIDVSDINGNGSKDLLMLITRKDKDAKSKFRSYIIGYQIN